MNLIFVALLTTNLALISAHPAGGLFEWQPSSFNSWSQMTFFYPSAGLLNSQSISLNQFNQKSKEEPQSSLWTAYSSFIMNAYPYSYYYSPVAFPYVSNAYLKQEIVNPKSKLFESTTQPLKSDSRLISAVKKVNPTYEIENILPIPGTRFFKLASEEKFPKKKGKGSTLEIAEVKTTNHDTGKIKVEATGKTSAVNSEPNISFGSYFLPYNSNLNIEDKKTSLILQPSSKAIVGNGGTAISAPLSRAVLKKGVPTNVLFNPESVAIAGAGGRAHAQADLILDLME